MPKTTEYVIEQDLTDLVADVLSNQDYVDLKSLRICGVIIHACMKIQMDDEDQPVKCKGNPVTLKKFGPAERLFIRDDAHLMLVFDFGTWENCSVVEREYYIYRALVSLSAEEKDDVLKFTKHKPDVTEHLSTLVLFGGKVNDLKSLETVFGTAAKATVAMISKKASKQKMEEEPEEETVPA